MSSSGITNVSCYFTLIRRIHVFQEMVDGKEHALREKMEGVFIVAGDMKPKAAEWALHRLALEEVESSK